MIVGRGVEKVEGRMGGQAVLVGTRLTIACLDAMWQAGGDALVARQYPYLTREQRMNAYGYAEEHRAEFKDSELAYGIEPDEVDGARKTLQDNLARYRREVSRLEALLSEPSNDDGVLSRLQVEHDAMATAGRQAHDECVAAQRRAARAFAALRLVQKLPLSSQRVQGAITLALRDEPPPPHVSVRDMGVGGPYRLFVGDHGIATWPSKPALEDPKGYAEEVARVLRLALGVTNV
jgi:uncharacterized protein (DUF433 family)